MKTALFTIAISATYTAFGAYYLALVRRHARHWAFRYREPVGAAPVWLLASFPIFLASLGPFGVLWGVLMLF